MIANIKFSSYDLFMAAKNKANAPVTRSHPKRKPMPSEYLISDAAYITDKSELTPEEAKAYEQVKTIVQEIIDKNEEVDLVADLPNLPKWEKQMLSALLEIGIVPLFIEQNVIVKRVESLVNDLYESMPDTMRNEDEFKDKVAKFKKTIRAKISEADSFELNELMYDPEWNIAENANWHIDFPIRENANVRIIIAIEDDAELNTATLTGIFKSDITAIAERQAASHGYRSYPPMDGIEIHHGNEIDAATERGAYTHIPGYPMESDVTKLQKGDICVMSTHSTLHRGAYLDGRKKFFVLEYTLDNMILAAFNDAFNVQVKHRNFDD